MDQRPGPENRGLLDRYYAKAFRFGVRLPQEPAGVDWLTLPGAGVTAVNSALPGLSPELELRPIPKLLGEKEGMRTVVSV